MTERNDAPLSAGREAHVRLALETLRDMSAHLELNGKCSPMCRRCVIDDALEALSRSDEEACHGPAEQV
jgi:hypothetical protein